MLPEFEGKSRALPGVLRRKSISLAPFKVSAQSQAVCARDVCKLSWLSVPGAMVTLRSEGKVAATAGEPSTSQPKKTTSVTSGRTARRSMTPDRASQDSTLRRSQRVKDRQGALESIQEDTAASAGDYPVQLLAGKVTGVSVHRLPLTSAVEAKPAPKLNTASAARPATLAGIPEKTAAVPSAAPVPEAQAAAVSRAQAVQNAILYASDATDSSQAGASHTSAAHSSADNSNAESTDDILAQLSENMWAALRPDGQTGAATQGAAQSQRSAHHSALHQDNLGRLLPGTVQAASQHPDAGSLLRQPVILRGAYDVMVN